MVKSALSVLVLLAALTTSSYAQDNGDTQTPPQPPNIISVPPRAITPRPEDPGNDSTLINNITPVVQNSSVSVPMPESGGSGPTVTCVPGSTTGTQTGNCPAGTMTVSGSTTFSQTNTTTTTCPTGSFGAPSTSTSPWTPAADASTCPQATINSASLPIDGKFYLVAASPMGSGGVWSAAATLSIVFNPDGSYTITKIANTASTLLFTAQWLPAGGSAADYSLTITSGITSQSNGTNGQTSVLNTALSGASLASTQSLSLGALFRYLGPSLPSSVGGGVLSASPSIVITNVKTGAKLTATIDVTCSADGNAGNGGGFGF